MIKSNEISVVVQGAIDKKNTTLCLKSIRKYLPDAEIILSTWEDSNVKGLDYDILVLNKDPGGFKHDYAIYNQTRSMNNFNRQLVSTKNGIKQAKRRYILKLRSDLILKSNNFLEYFDRFNVQNEKYKVFNHRVFCSSLFSREYSCQCGTGFPTPFHPSDFWFFGLTEDLKNYFNDCPLQSEDEASNWNFKYPNRCPYITPLWRFAPEQFFCVNWIKKYNFDLQFDDWSDWNQRNIDLSNNILYNNFVFLGFDQSGIYSSKYSDVESVQNTIQGLITYSHFQKRYKQYCDNSYAILKTNKNFKMRLQTHFQRCIKPLKDINSWVGELISTLFYIIACAISIFKKGK